MYLCGCFYCPWHQLLIQCHEKILGKRKKEFEGEAVDKVVISFEIIGLGNDSLILLPIVEKWGLDAAAISESSFKVISSTTSIFILRSSDLDLLEMIELITFHVFRILFFIIIETNRLRLLKFLI